MKFPPLPGLTKEEITGLLKKIGLELGFYVQTEVNTGVSRVDVVWFDRTLKPHWFKRPKKLETTLLIPTVGFEIEEKSSVRKIIRGDIDSLNSLYPLLGVLVLSRKIHHAHLERESKKLEATKKYHGKELEDFAKRVHEAGRRAERRWKTDLEFAYRVAGANPFRRIVVWTDHEVEELGKKILRKNSAEN